MKENSIFDKIRRKFDKSNPFQWSRNKEEIYPLPSVRYFP